MENQRVRSTFPELRGVACRLLGLAATLVLCATVNAAEKSEVAARISQTIESRFPGSHVVDVTPSPIPGLYEVYLGDEIVYSDPTGDYLVLGKMMDTHTKENLTDVRMDDHARIDFNALPLDKAIKIVKGNGSRKFAVFSDPDCPYCQQLEKTLLSLNDFTMYVFLYPIGSLHPQAPAKAHAIWCAPDRARAWNDWMHDKKLPAARSCSGDPVDALQQFGQKMKVNSTPTMYMANGRRVQGALPQPDLEKALASGNTNVARAPAAAP